MVSSCALSRVSDSVTIGDHVCHSTLECRLYTNSAVSIACESTHSGHATHATVATFRAHVPSGRTARTCLVLLRGEWHTHELKLTYCT